MLKVLYLPLGNQPGTVHGFEKTGVDLKSFDFFTHVQRNSVTETNNEFIKIASDFKPDLIHCQLQMTNVIHSSTISKIKAILPNTIITNWSGDIRRKVANEMVAMSSVVDYTLLSNVGQIDLYKQAGAKNVHYWQIGMDQKFSKPLNKTNFKYTVSFVGNCYDKQFPDAHIRSQVARRLRTTYKLKFGLFGSGYQGNLDAKPVDISEVNDIYNDSLCVLSISNFNDVSHYFSDRFLMCVGSGRPCITYRFPGVNNYFVSGKEVLVANDMDHLSGLVEYCVNNLALVNEIGMNGAIKAQAEHTFTSRALELIEIVGLSGKLYD